MRRARARTAAVILALALGAPGCGLIDSLAPLWVGTQDYGAGSENFNGDWEGETATGGGKSVTFQVGSDKVLNLHFLHITADCTLVFDALSLAPPIVDGEFTLDLPGETQGRFVATGKFTSATTCSGSYFFEALPAGPCPSAGRGTFVANKIL